MSIIILLNLNHGMLSLRKIYVYSRYHLFSNLIFFVHDIYIFHLISEKKIMSTLKTTLTWRQ